MADELDLLQEQDELLNQLHTGREAAILPAGQKPQPVRMLWQSHPPQAAAGHPGRTYLYGMPAGSGNTRKTVSEVTDGKKKTM
jgi:hypothetical protein